MLMGCCLMTGSGSLDVQCSAATKDARMLQHLLKQSYCAAG